jgi:hypothetical protein
LDPLRAQVSSLGPAGPRRALRHQGRELRRTFPIEKALKTGDLALDFTL